MAGPVCSVCGEEPIKSKKHQLGARCYGSIRVWSANKTEKERERRLLNLAIYSQRLVALNEGLIRIDHIKETANDRARRQDKKTNPRRR
jgi:hypothetical protein